MAAPRRRTREEVLIAMDSKCPLLGQARTDAIGTFAVLAPDGARPKAPFLERIVIDHRTPALDGNTVTVGQQHATAHTANCQIQAIERGLRGMQKQPDPFACLRKFCLGKTSGRLTGRGVKMVKCCGSPP